MAILEIEPTKLPGGCCLNLMILWSCLAEVEEVVVIAQFDEMFVSNCLRQAARPA